MGCTVSVIKNNYNNLIPFYYISEAIIYDEDIEILENS